MKKDRGYSFVEMIVILSILLILVLAGIETYVNMRKKYYDTSEKTIIAAMQTTVKAYYARNFSWPTANPFTLMTYPPPYVDGSYGDCKEAWGSIDEGSDWIIYCPHQDPFTNCSQNPSAGSYWKYYYSGANAGKIILGSSYGH